jgi:hypothetical protein
MSETIRQCLAAIETEAIDKGSYSIPLDRYFKCALRASFVRAYQFAAYCNKIKVEDANQGSFYMAGALRGSCEELIALKYISQLLPELRDEVIEIEMLSAVDKAAREQIAFFKKERRSQQVFQPYWNLQVISKKQDRLVEIAKGTRLWKPHPKKKNLPNIAEMAQKLGMTEVYNFLFRVTSDVVHFNPRISLRNGWGPDPSNGKFSTDNFAKYYLEFCQVYSVSLFTMFARAFAADLSLTTGFQATVTELENDLQNLPVWPPALTSEEMNR